MGTRKNKRVLVVDDSASIRALVGGALEEMNGVDVVEAGNGFEAIRLVTDDPFDLIITDVNMPEISGLELIRFVRTHPGREDTPIIVISTEGKKADQERALGVGANAYLAKPFETRDLKASVSKLLGESHARRG